MPLPSQRACTSVLPSLSLALASAPASIRSAMSLALQTREAACRTGGFAPYRPLTEAPAFNRRLTIATTSSPSPPHPQPRMQRGRFPPPASAYVSHVLEHDSRHALPGYD